MAEGQRQKRGEERKIECFDFCAPGQLPTCPVRGQSEITRTTPSNALLGIYVQIDHVDLEQRLAVGIGEHLHQGRIGVDQLPIRRAVIEADGRIFKKTALKFLNASFLSCGWTMSRKERPMNHLRERPDP